MHKKPKKQKCTKNPKDKNAQKTKKKIKKGTKNPKDKNAQKTQKTKMHKKPKR